MVASYEGGGGQVGPFDRYPVTPEMVRSAGDRVGSYGGNVEGLQGDVTGAHRTAQVSVAGLLSAPMVAAERPVQQRTNRWLQSAMFSGAAVRLFGDGVADYDRGIEDLNRRYWTAKQNNFGLTQAALPAEATAADRQQAGDQFRLQVAGADSTLLSQLKQEWHTVVEPALDDQADRVARLLDQGPENADAVVELYAAGALPWTAPVVFQNVNFNSVPAQLPPGVSGTDAAEMIRRALDGDASPEEFKEAMLLLQIVTDRAEYVQENGGYLTSTEVGFLHDFYNELGDDIWRVPDYIQKDEHHWDAASVNLFGWFDKDAPGFDDDTQDWMMTAMGTGLIALSNNQLWSPSLRSSDPMDLDSRYHLPETVIDLVTDPSVSVEMSSAGTASWLDVSADRMDDFHALAKMFGAAPEDMEAGTEFSESLTQRVAELAYATQRIADADLHTPGMQMTSDELMDLDRVAGTLGNLIDVSTRNEQANYNLLTGQTDISIAGIANHVGDSVYEMDDRQLLLQSLYGFDWDDDGEAVAGLTDWISERADEAARNEEYDPMATEAAAALIDLVTTTERGEGHDNPDDYRYNMYDELMQTLSEKNPEVARSFSGIAASYLGDISEPSASTTEVEGDGSLSLSDHDKIRFLDLIATDDPAINGLSTAAGAYEQRLLAAGLDSEVPMTEVGQRSSRLDGLLAAARVNADMVGRSQEFADAQAAYEEHMRYANYGKTAVTTGLGMAIDASPAKPVGPIINAGLGVLADEIVNGSIQAPEVDQGFDPGDILDQGRDDTYAAYDYLTAMNENGQLPDGFEIPDNLLQTAPPYSSAPFETTVYRDGHPVLKPIHELTGGERQELATLMGNEDSGIGGAEFDAYRNNYDASDSFDQAAVQGLDRAEAHRQGLR